MPTIVWPTESLLTQVTDSPCFIVISEGENFEPWMLTVFLSTVVIADVLQPDMIVASTITRKPVNKNLFFFILYLLCKFLHVFIGVAYFLMNNVLIIMLLYDH